MAKKTKRSGAKTAKKKTPRSRSTTAKKEARRDQGETIVATVDLRDLYNPAELDRVADVILGQLVEWQKHPERYRAVCPRGRIHPSYGYEVRAMSTPKGHPLLDATRDVIALAYRVLEGRGVMAIARDGGRDFARAVSGTRKRVSADRPVLREAEADILHVLRGPGAPKMATKIAREALRNISTVKGALVPDERLRLHYCVELVRGTGYYRTDYVAE